MAFRLGVDFGTSNTVAMLQWPDGRVRPLLFEHGPLLPSAVLVAPDRTRVGGDALHAARSQPECLEPSPKHRIDEPTVLLGTSEVPTVTLIAAVLKRVADEATRTAGESVAEVALCSPAAWGPRRRSVLIAAAERVGWPDVRLVAEPAAAARYFMDTRGIPVPVGRSVLVYDFGAGTFDVSLIRRTDGGFVVTATDGLPDAGGRDIDQAIIAYLGATYAGRDPHAWERLTEPRTSADRRLRLQVLDDVRRAKEMLSRDSAAQIYLPLLDVEAPLGRPQLEQLAAPIVRRTVATANALLAAQGLSGKELAAVFMVGGSSRVPLVAIELHRSLGIAPALVEQPELVVAEGSLLALAGGGESPADSEPAGAVPAEQPVPVPAEETAGADWPLPQADPDEATTQTAGSAVRSRRLGRVLAQVLVIALAGVGVVAIATYAANGDDCRTRTVGYPESITFPSAVSFPPRPVVPVTPSAAPEQTTTPTLDATTPVPAVSPAASATNGRC